jgi:Flp pilus assembly protein TadD
LDEAIPHFQQALRLKPDDAEAQNNLGRTFLQKGNVSQAITHFQLALQLDPANPSIQNNLAWLLATCPDAAWRNGDKAVQIARQANALTDGKNPIILHTLAAALAESGQFEQARRAAQAAIALAQAEGKQDWAGQFNNELKLYQAGRAFHLP